ncbi:site-specific integrase [Oceanidesulfovibrio indonesiensis]|uniref:Site-specific integrase n=1 Tax=Oceanidesulfovibrio indonesiensis TaxID=54767 RepID=A0A7M3MDU6_9BACT|nr:site-specific integrase [Oceanidesulfovibrio indonesiensis]TVM16441.1 site-specific integrase [Oceanidesulfovibrio indonesiensis]
MPHKFKRNGKWTGQWHGQVKVQGRRIRSPLMDNKEDAQAWEVDMRRHLAGQGADPTPQPTAMVSVIEWANRYLDYSQRYAPKTYSEKKNVMKRLVKAFGKETLMVSITPAKALEHLQGQYQQRSGYAANKERKNLSAAWEWGLEFLDGFPDGKNPFKKRKALTFPASKNPRYVPPESDFWRVVGKAEGQDKVLLLTLIFTGARIGELFRLRWSDVDFIERRVSLNTKKRENGSMEADWIPMTDALFDVLLEHRQNSTGEWVFVQQEGRNKGRQIKEYRGFPKELCKKAEVKPFDNHGIRHLTASVLARNSVPQVVIKNILRHKSLRMSDRYVHGPEDMRPYLGVLEGGLSNLEVQHEVQQ